MKTKEQILSELRAWNINQPLIRKRLMELYLK